MLAPELLKLLYLVSPALPVGAYAYSQGQEYAVDSGWLDGDQKLSDWLKGVLQHSVGTCDLPILLRCYSAWQNRDIGKLREWNDFLIATRETKELLLEDSQLGMALARVLEAHGIETHRELGLETPSFAVLFALAGVEWGIAKDALLQGFAWSWLENQVAAATKTIPLGQTQAQKILMSLLEYIPEVVERAQELNDDEIGAGLPGLALASSLHERQYSRLFRS
ncbi:MAG: hypothetical protein KTR16_07595 [Acidiferrobacterales bacterium]|nr:hypothetical protein [Acidiferrobacterales bacterium]